jgi:hypothetical protein
MQQNKTMELTVQNLGWPKQGKKMGWIKTSEGQFLSLRPAMLTQFQKGEVCHVTYVEGDMKDDGTRWLTIVGKQAGAPGGPQQKVVPQLRAATNPTDAEQMFVVALLKETTLPSDSLDMLKARGKQYKQLYQYLFGTQEKQKNDSRMDDEIPEGPPDYPEEGNWDPA